MSTTPSEIALDAMALRRCFGRFATGVTVVTYQVGSEVHGATVNSFTSVSLDPPLVLVSLARTTRACGAMEGRPFAVNVLGADQEAIALQFAGQPQYGLDLTWDAPAGDDDPPTLSAAVAVLHCRPWRRYDGGDHVLHVGWVANFEIRPGEPLLFSDGRFLSMADGRIA